MSMLIDLAERGILPDRFIRYGIGLLNRQRLREEHRGGIEALREHQRSFVRTLRESPIAVLTDAANEQHYEVPHEFFSLILGKRRKYSCCYYPSGQETLDEESRTDLGALPHLPGRLTPVWQGLQHRIHGLDRLPAPAGKPEFA